jgi:hypothetical protein
MQSFLLSKSLRELISHEDIERDWNKSPNLIMG